MAATKAKAKTAKKTAKKTAGKGASKKPAGKATKKTASKKPAEKKSMAAAEEKGGYTFSARDQKTKYESEGLSVPVSCVRVVKGFNPRVNIGDMVVLEASIKVHGVLVPLLVTRGNKPGSYDLVAGERRFTIAKKFGRTTVPVIIRADLDDPMMRKAVAVSENSDDARKGLNYIELGRVFVEQTKAGWDKPRIAKANGLTVSKVRRCLDLMKAPADVQKQVESGDLSMIAGLEVAKLDDATRKKIKDSLKDGISAADVRKMAKKAVKDEGKTATDGKTSNKKTGKDRDASLRAWKGHREVQAILQEMAYYLSKASGEEVGTTEYHELRGAVAVILWQRGDLDSPLVPSLDPESDPECENVSAAKKLNKTFNALVVGEAAKHEPEDDAEE